MEQRLANLKWLMDNRSRWHGLINPAQLVMLITCIAPVCWLWHWLSRS